MCIIGSAEAGPNGCNICALCHCEHDPQGSVNSPAGEPVRRGLDRTPYRVVFHPAVMGSSTKMKHQHGLYYPSPGSETLPATASRPKSAPGQPGADLSRGELRPRGGAPLPWRRASRPVSWRSPWPTGTGPPGWGRGPGLEAIEGAVALRNPRGGLALVSREQAERQAT